MFGSRREVQTDEELLLTEDTNLILPAFLIFICGIIYWSN